MAAIPAAIQGNFFNNPRGDYPPVDLPLITVASQNCNSLNISTECRKQLTKMIAITALLTDFIFLSDIRLNTSAVHIERISKQFLYEGKRSYKLYTNPNINRRGVGLLMAADLPGELGNFYKDDEQNLLAATYDTGQGKIRLVLIVMITVFLTPWIGTCVQTQRYLLSWVVTGIVLIRVNQEILI
jgi:hypothetical protein